MKDTKYKILAYFDNQSYRKLFNEVNSDYAENLQILLHNLSLFSYDMLVIGVIVYKENISCLLYTSAGPKPLEKAGQNNSDRRTPPLLPSRSCRSCAVCKRWGD